MLQQNEAKCDQFEEGKLISHYCKKQQFDRAPTIISHFGCNNIIFANCIFKCIFYCCTQTGYILPASFVEKKKFYFFNLSMAK